jgi:hypothetical protein
MTKLPPSQEQRCPVCGERFTVTAPARKKKIQCPHCRAIVSASNPVLFKRSEDAGDDLPLASEPEWKTQCQLLRARVEHLETQVEALLRGRSQISAARRDEEHSRYATSPPDAEISFPSGVSEGARPPDKAASSERQRRVGDQEIGEISVLTTCEDGGKVRVIEMLASILTDAGWKIRRGSHVGNGAGASPGLTLVVSPALCRARLSRTVTALSTAGFSVTLRLDQSLPLDQTTLFVGDSVEYPSQEASEVEPSAIAEVA